jgi:hypothetical protein
MFYINLSCIHKRMESLPNSSGAIHHVQQLTAVPYGNFFHNLYYCTVLVVIWLHWMSVLLIWSQLYWDHAIETRADANIPSQEQNYVSQVVPLPLAQAKSDDKQFWKIKVSCTGNEKALNMHALMRGAIFVLWGEGEGVLHCLIGWAEFTIPAFVCQHFRTRLMPETSYNLGFYVLWR